MALRVTQGLMYNSFVNNMNKSLSSMMETNMQASSQKRVNRPSDDPVSAGRILSSRNTLDSLAIYEDNLGAAQGWLTTADSLLTGNGGVTELLVRLTELAEQGSTSTYTADNRLEMSYELRTLFDQLMNIANKEYAGSHMFAGHKTDQPAYQEGLGVTAIDQTDYGAGATTVNNVRFHVEGGTSTSMVIRATTDGTVGTADFEYSNDGGKTWQTATVNNDTPKVGESTIIAGGVTVRVSDSDTEVTAVDPENPHSNKNGTWLYVRPTAVYQGDDHDTQVGAAYLPSGVMNDYNTEDPTDSYYLGAEGYFSRDIVVRVDDVDSTTTPPTLTYSYTADNGSNWVQASAPYPTDPTSSMHLPVPGGYMVLGSDAVPDASDIGTQFVIHPHRAEINYQIGADDYIAVNLVGKDVFGGLYDYPGDIDENGDLVDYPVPVSGSNLFEVVGNLIAAAETNSQQGFQEALPQLKELRTHILTRAAEIGGRENRLQSTYGALVTRQYAEEDNLSRMEDVDVTQLTARMAQEETTYLTVLKSSSMIMQMSLVNFL